MEFTKQFLDKSIKDIYYEGEANADLTKIQGKWSSDKSKIKKGGRFDIAMASKVSCEFEINYSKNGTIRLEGQLDLENATLSGKIVSLPDDYVDTFATDSKNIQKSVFELVSSSA